MTIIKCQVQKIWSVLRDLQNVFYWKSEFWRLRLRIKRHISSNKSLIPAPKSDGSRNKNKLKIEVYIKSIKKTAYKWPIGPRLRSSFFSLNVWLDQTFNEIRKISRFSSARLPPPSTNGTLQLWFCNAVKFVSYSVHFQYVFSMYQVSTQVSYSLVILLLYFIKQSSKNGQLAD